MKLALNFRNGKKRVFTQQETDQIIKKINYLKLIQFFMSNKELKGKINILGKEISSEDIFSIEFLM
ncbi:hypothetical protein HAHI6034_01205 [Hathewaya histolytica]|uniref:Uncharacterized protein n=1 Tax=Hathewaya histolytica TaxID=1498 RepID=A0A4U9R1C2_HATHI|nr:hypothetical protein [Hathewaya histolytica]VTQ83683.1 Uncharacterised protein [Hathewaya histolytica]